MFFTNSRRLAEKITLKLNETEVAPLAYAHHGSLAREIRSEVETRLKSGELRAIVATNSLEMGIDIGAAEKPIVEPVPTVPALADLGFEQLPGPRGVADDLKKLPGISPAIEKQLNDLGIFHYSQIAALNEKAAHNIGEEVGLPGRVPGWIAKAKELTAE